MRGRLETAIDLRDPNDEYLICSTTAAWQYWAGCHPSSMRHVSKIHGGSTSSYFAPALGEWVEGERKQGVPSWMA